MKEISKIVSGFKENIFSQMTNLANKYNAVNLSQGYPDFDGAGFALLSAKVNIDKGFNQTTNAIGCEELRMSIKKYIKRKYNLNYDHNTEITVTCGATEAMYDVISALVNPEDEVIVFEPFFDIYVPAILMNHGKVKTVTLHGPQFSFDKEELRRAFSEKTKLVIVNTPHNPTGHVFTKNELQIICDLVKEYDAYLVTDEVYEFLTYDNHVHIPPATLDGMRERTIMISSSGKTFGLTGWRTGWAITVPALSNAIRLVHQNNTFSGAHPLQKAIGESFEKLDEYLPDYRGMYLRKRDILFNGLTKLGYRPLKPEGTYFIMCPIRHMTQQSDIEFAKDLIINKKVATIPPSAFYINSNEGHDYIRFCFAKKDETLYQALENLSSL
ncbi:MAG: hypothetical protein A2381_20270 [Bdellovibrionales bacterium RIFOXYB1_FULL_37_110]|nr:MAG: hypothetical protein A2181_03905 [Bdellovibrionales bacterium RIFOXYA1_FULL_38_20]OFZ51072.1 MAG: hypothetical protein A2417_20055 [Bdellovibrionales bacterium RIFOXYC1_FULL_37_79]OFZ60284.1 MAG: hypothetical protein A2381_20270 [Bdellovibrionales bacterium RIFOXYB1_FULL_37_110]OFZ63279.1 MAG: hypothetical protein A2577_01585 [Bdellovibrionales bacterium RIFOXYD1_FULL_36_51]